MQRSCEVSKVHKINLMVNELRNNQLENVKYPVISSKCAIILNTIVVYEGKTHKFKKINSKHKIMYFLKDSQKYMLYNILVFHT